MGLILRELSVHGGLCAPLPVPSLQPWASSFLRFNDRGCVTTGSALACAWARASCLCPRPRYL